MPNTSERSQKNEPVPGSAEPPRRGQTDAEKVPQSTGTVEQEKRRQHPARSEETETTES